MITKSNSTKNIDKKIFAVQSAAPVIRKQADNPYFKSKYAEYPEIQADIRPLTIKEGLLVNFAPVIGDQLVLTVKDIETGEYYEVVADLKSGQATPQAQGSAITYLKRYMITAFFDLIIEDAMDDDGNAGSGKKQEPKAATQTQQPTQPAAPAPVLPWLNKDTREWVKAKDYIFNAGKSVKDIQKKFKINKENLELLPKMEPLKPGTSIWDIVTVYVHDGMKPENVIKMFEITEEDMQDLLIDATNYTPAPREENKPTEANTTKK